MDDTLYCLRIRTGGGFGPVVEAGLELLGLEMISAADLDAGTVVFEEYFVSPDDARAREGVLRENLREWAETGDSWELSVDRLEPADWQDKWKEYFHTRRISRRLVIKPTWESYESAPGDCVIEIDPGMTFGTGLHFTTRFCLSCIDELAGEATEGRSFCDLGCGSGILAIAAAKLGFRNIVALDYDPTAVRIAGENLLQNGVKQFVDCVCEDVGGFRPGRTFDVVAANITAPLLERFAPVICSLVEPGGLLMLSGILSSQYDAVRTAYCLKGFRELKTDAEGEWRGGLFRSIVPNRSSH